MEMKRLADQLRRLFNGGAFHGESIREVLAGVTREQSRARPIEKAHTIAELVEHIHIWNVHSVNAVKGVPIPKWPGGRIEDDWPEPGADWERAQREMYETAEELAKLIESSSAELLKKTVPGRDYSFEELFAGQVQHGLWHAGQMAVLKKAANS